MPAASHSAPAPLGGWNDRDPLADMDPLDAIRLVNVFPNAATCDLRKGYRIHSTGLGTGAVQHMAEYAGPTGTRQLIAFANNKVYNATTYNAAATDITNGATITSNKWLTVNFRGKLLMCNGTDQPLQWSGSALTSATYTGIADDNKCAHVQVYKSRLYFCQTDTASIWYGNVNEITGVLTEYAVGGQLQRGGFVQFTTSFTRDMGQGTEDLFVIVSNMGEVLLYSGDYPGAINWIQAGQYFMPTPIGRKAVVKLGADIGIITELGLISLTSVLGGQELPKGISDKIRNTVRLSAQNYKANYGWQAISYPRGRYLCMNVPTSESSDAEQYVMNTDTGAWCRFTGQRACSWCLLNEKLYFGGVDGKVYEADYGASDNARSIRVNVKGAFSYCGSKFRTKRFTLGRPLVRSDANLSFIFNVDTDYTDRVISDTASTDTSAGAEWDEADWDTADWATEENYSSEWSRISGIGRCVAPRLMGDFMGVSFSISAFDYIFEQGGVK